MLIKNRIQRGLKAAGRSLPYVAGGISVSICLLCASQALSFGLSRLYAARAVENKDLSAADKAVLLAHSDPQALSARASVLAEQKRLNEALVDLKHALNLSPRDGKLWIKLADCYAQLNDTEGAISAYSEATRLVPYNALAHWLLGNTLLKAGCIEKAFIEFRRASTSRPSLFVNVIELAWQSYSGDPHAVQQALQPQTVQQRIALALFFGEHGRLDEGAPLMKDAVYLPTAERLSLLRGLLDSNRFVEAYEVWSAGRATESGSRLGPITDGGFEGEIGVDNPAFGWRFKYDFKTANASLDETDPHSGRQSLRLDWHGDPYRSARIVEQLVLAAPKARYRLSFAARTQSLTTICLPVINVTSVNPEGETLLGQSHPLTQGSSEWRNYIVDFATTDSSQVVLISVTRDARTDGPCPIFGSVWLDDFSLQIM